MVANPKRELHELIDRLSDEAARQLTSALREAVGGKSSQPRPLRKDDIILSHPLPPEDEEANDMIETVRRWRTTDGG